MHLWAGGRCPLPESWWMVAPSGQEWKWEGRGQAHEPESTPLPPEIEIFSDTLKIGILIYSIREWMFHLVWWWKPSCVPVNCILWHPLPLIHSEKVNICTSSMADVRLSRVSKKINYLVYLNAVVILGRAGHSAIDCPQGRLFCFWGRGEMNGYLMEHWERGWPGICVPVLCQWGWEPSAGGDHMLSVDISKSKRAWSWRYLWFPRLSRALLLKAHSCLLAPGPYFLFVPGCVAALCGSTHIRRKYVSILPLPLAEVTSSAWPSWPRHSAPIIFPLANLSVLISIILPCLLRALTALTVSLSK